jgi:RNA polymerase sigma-70 factor (ECF subfamily)
VEKQDLGISSGVLRLTAGFDDDAGLVRRCVGGDRDAFGKLVDRYSARIFGYVSRSVSNFDEAQDVAQEVFIRAFRSLSKFDGRASFATWLFKIAANLCIDKSRKRKGEPRIMPLLDEIAETDRQIDTRWDPESLAIAGEMERAVETCVGRMSDKLRSVLLLHDQQFFGYEEIAEILGVPVGTVKSRLYLARARIQETIEEYTNGGNRNA